MAKPARSDLVVSAWLATIPGITADIVGTKLPGDTSLWAPTGFVQVGPEFGPGLPAKYIPLRSPVMQLDTWGVNPDQAEPNWQQAADLAELIWEAAYGNLSLGIPLTLPQPGYRQARVQAVFPTTEPHRELDDITAYGHYSLDLEFRWIEYDE